jgi:shikimate kinase
MKNIILIGYRCTGKTSVGKKAAEKLGLPFLDTDEVIIREAQMSVEEIVRAGGWPLFRRKEKEAIMSLSSLEGAVIATGGGTFEDPENYEALRGTGLFVWLTADGQTIVERMRSDGECDGQRPPLSGEGLEAEVAEMTRKREPVYRGLADMMIDTSHKRINEIANEIVRFIQEQEI